MTARRETVPLSSLLLDPENARHGTLGDQGAALSWMASQPKVVALARSIATQGLNPSELLLVMPATGDNRGLFIVLEGNRRTAALKLLHDPEKCPDVHLRAKFRKIRHEMQVELPTELECVVFPDLAAASLWLEVRHLGEQEGAGTVPWGAKENEYFARRLGRQGPNTVALQLMEYALTQSLISREDFAAIPVTNVSRLIATPEVRRELGMDLRKGEVFLVADESYFKRALATTLRGLTSPHITVSALKSKEQRVDFVQTCKQQERLGSYQVLEEIALSALPSEAQMEARSENHPAGQPALQGATPQRATRSSRDSLARKYAVSSGTHMKIANPKMNAIFRELKTLEVDKFPHAAAVLTRVFIEGCADLYIAKHNLSRNNLRTLADKVGRVRQHIVDSNKDTHGVKDALKGLEVFAGDHLSIGSANTFNAIVHNTDFRVTASEVKATWDRLEPSLPWLQGNC